MEIRGRSIHETEGMMHGINHWGRDPTGGPPKGILGAELPFRERSLLSSCVTEMTNGDA